MIFKGPFIYQEVYGTGNLEIFKKTDRTAKKGDWVLLEGDGLGFDGFMMVAKQDEDSLAFCRIPVSQIKSITAINDEKYEGQFVFRKVWGKVFDHSLFFLLGKKVPRESEWVENSSGKMIQKDRDCSYVNFLSRVYKRIDLEQIKEIELYDEAFLENI